MSAPKRFVFVAALLSLAAVLAFGQDAKREAQLRTVHGVVLDKSENLIAEECRFPEKYAYECGAQLLHGHHR